MPSRGRTSYGPIASTFVDCFSPEEPVVIFDHAGCAEALRDCAQRRFNDEAFFVRVVLQREYALRTDAVLPSILSSISGRDERRFAIEQAFAGVLGVNGQPIGNLSAYDAGALRLMQASVRLADGLIVSGESERRRIGEILNVDPHAVVRDLSDVRVPLRESARQVKGDGIVLWAAHLQGDAALSFAFALADLRLPIYLVTAQQPTNIDGLNWFPLERSGEALGSAKLIVDTSPFGCDAIARLSSWGTPLVADVESGAQEAFDGVRVFDRRRMSSIFEAAISAIGMEPPRPRSKASQQILTTRAGSLLRSGPRVSVIIPTLDRTAMLRDALESVARQSYGNVETIVVVDGGPRLDALAEQFPNVVFLHMEKNNPVVSSNAAFAATTGDYVTLLSDDDLFFPDHIAELVTALERSGGSVAHGDVLTAYLRSEESGWTLYGLESNMSRAAEASSLLVSNQVGAVGVMFRRNAVSGKEPFDDSIPFCRDYALWLRLSLAHDFVHVERITTCYTIRNRGAAQQSIMWAGGTLKGHRALYERYPVTGRPLLQQRREQILRSIEQGTMGLAGDPAAQVAPISWPLWDDSFIRRQASAKA